ncbi:MAG: hypothetical protein OXD43_09495 [Bacteroidetes bacterium]|nr:hypothetical protein [Bacteroidota bacterium]
MLSYLPHAYRLHRATVATIIGGLPPSRLVIPVGFTWVFYTEQFIIRNCAFEAHIGIVNNNHDAWKLQTLHALMRAKLTGIVCVTFADKVQFDIWVTLFSIYPTLRFSGIQNNCSVSFSMVENYTVDVGALPDGRELFIMF